MRTFAHAINTDNLGRYYTDALVSRLLVNALSADHPINLMDLGAGEGSLSLAASTRWSGLDLVTVDLDPKASKVLATRLNEGGFTGMHRHVDGDALSTSLPKHLREDLHLRPTLAVCNPPFLVPKWRKGYGEIVEDVGFSGCLPAVTHTDAALLFLAQNLRALEADGTVGIIVPDSLVSASKYLGFRRVLLDQYDVQQAIRLPRASFVGTDAQAHILVVSKRRPKGNVVVLSNLSGPHGKLINLTVDRDKAAERLDYQFHVLKNIPQLPTLSSVTLDVRRGSYNSAEVRAHDSFILHTTNISAEMRGSWFEFGNASAELLRSSPSSVVAESGDIVLARVGRNAANKVIGVAGGSVAISDCLYKIRVKPQHRLAVMHALVSDPGNAWLNAKAYGVAARQLSKADLLNLPLDLK